MDVSIERKNDLQEPTRLLNANYVLLWQGQFVSRAGSELFSIAMMLWVKEVTESSSILGILMMLASIPAVFSSALGGVFADRFSRKKIIVTSDAISGLLMFSLGTLMFMYPTHVRVILLGMFIVVTLNGIVSSFFIPAVTASIPSIVPREMIERANSLRQASFRVAGFIGTAIGGFLYKAIGAPMIVLINGLTYWISAISESFIKIPDVQRSQREDSGTLLAKIKQDLKEGFEFMWHFPGLRGLFLASAILNFFTMPIMVLLPFYVLDFLKIGEEWVGLLLLALGVGSLMGSIFAGIFRFRGKRRAVVLILAMLVQGLTPIALGLFIVPSLAVIFACLSGMMGGFIFVNIISILQQVIATEMRGRVFGLLNTFSASIAPLGMGVGGIVGDLTGKNIPLVFIACGTIIIFIILMVAMRRSFRQFLAFDQPKTPESMNG
ncbi:MAG: MFS transporter [Calditrichaeota bacterium]|nr:MFS transporter [Calditrichota bacterium]